MVKRFLGLAAVAAAVLTGAKAFAADKIVYQLDWLPSGEETFPYVAQQEGYFTAAGLDVEIRTGRGTTDVLTKMSTGTAEFGSGGLGALMQAAAENKVPVKAVLSIYNKQPDAIFTYEGSGIKTLKDLAGKTVATQTFTSSNALWPVVAAMNGLDISRVRLVKTDPTASTALLATGHADALINWMTVGGEIGSVLEQAGKKMVVLPWSSLGLNGYGLSLFASDNKIAKHPDLVARFVTACEKAIVFSLDHPEAAVKDLKAMVPIIDVKSALIEANSTIPLTRNEISATYGMGTFDPQLVKDTWKWIAKAQSYPLDKLNPEAVIDRSFVPRS